MTILSKEATQLKSKIALSRKKFSALRKKADFDALRTGPLIEFARYTKNSALLRLLACHPDNTVRDEVAYNQFSSYETLLGLLGDTDIDVIRTVLLYGKLEEDFIVLSEKFFPEKEKGLFYKLNENQYLPLIKLKGRFARWNVSQSFYLLHNKHLGISALKSLDIDSFAPFRGNGLKILLKLRETRITEVSNNIPFSKRKRAPKETLPTLWRRGYLRKSKPSLSSKESNEIEIFLSQQIDSQKNPSIEKKKLADSDDISRDQLNNLLKSNDKKIVISALRNKNITIKDLDEKFCDFPEIVLENPKFHGRLEKKPSLLRWMDANQKIKILKNKKDCPSVISESLVKEYIDYIKHPHISVSDSMSKWGNWLQVIVSHGSTCGTSLYDLYHLLHTRSTNISKKRLNLIKEIEKNPKFNEFSITPV